MAIHERLTNRGSKLLHHYLMDGGIFAEPVITPGGETVMTIIGWNCDEGRETIIDQKALFNGFSTIHHIPMRVLDCAFYVPNQKEGMRFTGGGSYSRVTEWDYPFHGRRIGAWVKRYDTNANANGELANNRGSINEHAGAANA